MHTKSLLKCLLLALTKTTCVFATDFTGVGTNGPEYIADYSYSRTINTSYYSATHVGVTGFQYNLDNFGSASIEIGDTQTVTNYRANSSTLIAGYANGVHLPADIWLLGGVSYALTTGDKWLPMGKNSALPINAVNETVEVNFPVINHARLYSDYIRSTLWQNSFRSISNSVVAGTYISVTRNLTLVFGGGRSYSVSAHSWDFMSSLCLML